jgi:glycosyltransferase involved in cell wall biosynthesis
MPGQYRDRGQALYFSMRVGLYVDFDVGHLTGIGRYGVEIARALKCENVLSELWMNRCLGNGPSTLDSLNLPRVFFHRFRRISDIYWPAFRFRKAELDVIHCPNCTLINSPFPVKQSVMIHDMGPFLYPEMKCRSDTEVWQKRIRRAASHAEVITANSLATRNDLLNTFPDLEKRVFLTPLGTDHFPAREGHSPGGRHILAVGTVEPRKNYRALLEAYSILAASRGLSLPPLVITGSFGFRSDQITGYAAEYGIADRVTFTGYATDTELDDLYRNAACLVHTAHYEGFGLIIPEAFSWNLPVAAPDNTAIREYFSKAAWMLDTSDPESVADGISLCLDKGVSPEQQLERNRLADLLTWGNCAEKTLDAFRKVLS